MLLIFSTSFTEFKKWLILNGFHNRDKIKNIIQIRQPSEIQIENNSNVQYIILESFKKQYGMDSVDWFIKNKTVSKFNEGQNPYHITCKAI